MVENPTAVIFEEWIYKEKRDAFKSFYDCLVLIACQQRDGRVLDDSGK